MTKQIESYSKTGGYLLKLYWSINAAAEELKITPQKVTELVQTGQPYKGILLKEYYAEDFNYVPNFYPIQQYDKPTNKIINRFKTILEASTVLEYSRNSISNHIRYDSQDRFGYYWRKIEKTS